MPASPGTFIGQAVLARRASPDAILEPPNGVLVLESAGVEWLEAITQAGAVVTEVGGRTSHAATICRELGKPCVTAVANLTALVSPGTLLAVDGGAGTVTILRVA
jgi:phosphohistidine swiveling domain-containing protein